MYGPVVTSSGARTFVNQPPPALPSSATGYPTTTNPSSSSVVTAVKAYFVYSDNTTTTAAASAVSAKVVDVGYVDDYEAMNVALHQSRKEQIQREQAEMDAAEEALRKRREAL